MSLRFRTIQQPRGKNTVIQILLKSITGKGVCTLLSTYTPREATPTKTKGIPGAPCDQMLRHHTAEATTPESPGRTEMYRSRTKNLVNVQNSRLTFHYRNLFRNPGISSGTLGGLGLFKKPGRQLGTEL